jgi:hypothetical protein
MPPVAVGAARLAEEFGVESTLIALLAGVGLAACLAFGRVPFSELIPLALVLACPLKMALVGATQRRCPYHDHPELGSPEALPQQEGRR